jgi:hypothetical protein
LAKLIHLTASVAEALRGTEITKKSVRETARRLQEAGLIKRGKPGRYGGAEMGVEDGVALIAAIVGAGDKRDVIKSAETAKLTLEMIFDHSRSTKGYLRLTGLKKQHTFKNALLTLVEKRPLEAFSLFVSVNRPFPQGMVEILDMHGDQHVGRYSQPDVVSWFKRGFRDTDALAEKYGDPSYATRRTVGGSLIDEIRLCLFGPKYRGHGRPIDEGERND